MLLFKYLSPEGARIVLGHQKELVLRFSLPRDYNDPYELFLQPDRRLEDEEQRAFYDFFVGDVPQLPITCFSRDPNSVVMWAHYARESTGLCLGLDEDALTDHFEIAYIDDVRYSDDPAQIDAGVVDYVFATGKRRHTIRLIELACSATYFLKRTDWRYERERRLVVFPDELESSGSAFVARIRPDAVRYIIVGNRAPDDLRRLCEARTQEMQNRMLTFRIGKRTFEPFFVDQRGSAWHWRETEFEECDNVCRGCGEPSCPSSGDVDCDWCSIDEEARQLGPKRSGLALSLHLGIDKAIPIGFDKLRPKGRASKSKPKSGDPSTSPFEGT